jgi:exo-beta-1,3-glucanase (GH17 family)
MLQWQKLQPQTSQEFGAKFFNLTVHIPPAPPSTSSSAVAPTSAAPVVAPTPAVTTCPTPGVYTIPETTITLTESTTVCAATSTSVPAGTHTVGGVTTIVETSTTIVCPYATVSTSGGVTTSTILTTTYVCPEAGTYTIAPITTTVVSATILVYPTAASYPPGTYHQPEVITTVTETDYVIFCPYTSMEAAPATSAAAPVASNSAPGPALGSSGNQWAITYTPYTSSGACKAASDVAADMAAIKAAGFSTVRIYATDCSGLQNVGAGCQAVGLKMVIGVFIESSGISAAQEQVTEIVAWGQWDLVELIVIGNEAIFNGYCTPSELASFISSCKSAFSAAGYHGPCTTTEPLNVLQEYTEIICEVVDVVGCNIHPFFNADIDASQAGSFVASQLQIVDDLCAGLSGINLETGWPSAGTSCNGVACPTPENQKIAIDAIIAAAGGQSAIFSFSNDHWKDPGSFGCEQFWGVIGLFV